MRSDLMSKYYRVRTQEQWDWLKNKLEIKGDLHVSYFPVTILDGDIFCGIYKYHDDPEPLIEVSQMMEDEKMEDYVTIKGEDLKNVEMFCGNESKGNLREFWDISKVNIPKPLLYPKVKFTEEEKREFDRLKENALSLRFAFDELKSEHGNYPKLCERLFNNTLDVEDSKAQNDFARAWADESLIEVIPDKKWNVKVPHIENRFYFKHTDGGLKGSSSAYNDDYNQQFTVEELKYYGLEDESIYKRVEVEE